MRKILLLLFFFPLLIKGVSQTNPFDPQERSGDTITINGRIYAGNYLKNVITKPTFLNVYDSNPSRMLMLRIDSGDRKNFAVAPEKYYLNKKVTVRGVLGDYRGVALLKIVDTSNLLVDTYDKGPEPVTSTGNYMSGQDYGFGKADSLFRKRNDSIKAIIDADPSRSKKSSHNFINRDSISSVSPESSTTDSLQQVPATPSPIVKTGEPKQAMPAADKQPQETKQPEVAKEPTASFERNEAKEPQTIKEPELKKEPETDIETIDNRPDQVRQIRLKNLPVFRAPPAKPAPDTSAKAVWLKSISNQEFQSVNDELIVQTEEIEMRSAPTTDAPVIAYIMKQMTVLVTYKSEKWSYLTVQNPDGSSGMSGFIKNRTYKHLKKK